MRRNCADWSKLDACCSGYDRLFKGKESEVENSFRLIYLSDPRQNQHRSSPSPTTKYFQQSIKQFVIFVLERALQQDAPKQDAFFQRIMCGVEVFFFHMALSLLPLPRHIPGCIEDCIFFFEIKPCSLQRDYTVYHQIIASKIAGFWREAWGIASRGQSRLPSTRNRRLGYYPATK